MKLIQVWLIGAVIAVMVVTQGCALFLIGAGAGTAAGAVSYSGNELQTIQDVGLNRAWDAANAAMKDMEFTIIPAETKKDGSGGVLQGRNAKDQRVRIQLVRQTDNMTEIRIRVGTFETSANKAAAQALYDKLKARL